VRIPRALALETTLDEGDEVELQADDLKIITERSQPNITG
jgi:antitoxin component of MazEF toxin-antitoxin module